MPTLFHYFQKIAYYKQTAQKFFDNILSKGGTLKPMQLYINFRGKKPTNTALLKRAGLVK